MYENRENGLSLSPISYRFGNENGNDGLILEDIVIGNSVEEKNNVLIFNNEGGISVRECIRKALNIRYILLGLISDVWYKNN